MTIRSATASDIVALASLIHRQHRAMHGWQPDLWPLHHAGEAQQAAHLQARFGRLRAKYVVESPSAAETGLIDGAALVSDLVGAHAPTWIVDELTVADPSLWASIGAVLLARVAADARAGGIAHVVVSTPTADTDRSTGLRSAGIELNCWFRHLRIGGAPGEPFTPTDRFEPGLPLPHLHGLVAATAAATSVKSPGAHSLLSPRLAPPKVFADRGTFRLADPVIANDEPGLWGALDEVEQRCAASGDSSLLIAVGPGEEPLDEMAERRGYDRVVDWGVITLDR